MSQGVERRLAAIMAMDVVGYSRLMGIDEVGTLSALKRHRAELIDPATAVHHGRLVKTTGDGLLLEFASVVDAIACAVAIQRGMLSRNAPLREDMRIVFRVGINIGDIIIDGNDIFGDGVNVAARLETLCEPGGICISRAANEQVRDKVSLAFADLGEHTVKNIARAVGVFGLRAEDIARLPDAPLRAADVLAVQAAQAAPAPRPGRRLWLGLGLVGAALAAGAALWLGPGLLPQPAVGEALAAALAQAIPGAPARYREEAVAGYLKHGGHRAMAVAPVAQRAWRTGEWSGGDVAAERALEKCQLHFNEPCALLATDDRVIPPAVDGTWPLRDAPRLRHTGGFDPARMPALREQDLRRPVIAGYAAAPAPKAMALHASGAVHAATGAASQHAAERQALEACGKDARVRESGGPCFLYAAENRVVLPLRASAPLARAPVTAPVAAAAPPAAPREIRAVLIEALAKASPAQARVLREEQVQAFLAAREHRALAAFPPAHTWRSTGWGSERMAEQRALEGCQLRYGEPCILVAVNRALRLPATGAGERRAMAELAYDGPFEARRIPIVPESVRTRPDVAAYPAAAGPKAAALHPLGRLTLATGAPSQQAAEQRALEACNQDPDRKDGPCYLYAAGDRVVLPRRATEPLAAAKP